MTTIHPRGAPVLRVLSLAALVLLATGPGLSALARPAGPDAATGPATTSIDGWTDLPLRGARGVEVIVEADAKIDVRLVREADGRVRARFLTADLPAPSAVAAGEGGLPGVAKGEAGLPGVAKGEAGLPGVARGEAGWETSVALDLHRESGIAYLTEPETESRIDLPLEIEIEMPARLTLTITGRRADVRMTGESQSIPGELPPFVPVPEEQRRGRAASSQAANAPASIPREQPEVIPIARAYGGAISVRCEDGSVTGIDLSNPVSIGLTHGDIRLERVAGKVDVESEDASVSAEGIAGPLTVTGGSSVTLRAIHHLLNLTGSIADVDLRGVIGASDLKITNGSVRAEDMRARFRANVRDGSVSMRDIRYGAQVDVSGGDLDAESLDGRVHINADGSNVSIRGSEGSVMVRGSPSGVRIERSKGAVDVRTNRGDVSVRDVEGTVTVVSQKADVELEGVSGQILVKSAGGWASITDSVSRQIRVDAETIEAEYDTAPAAGTNHTYNATSFARVVLPDGWYMISARARGEIDSDFPVAALAPEPGADRGEGDDSADGSEGDETTASNRPPGSRVRTAPQPVIRREPGKPGGGRFKITSGGDIEIISG